MTHTEHNPESEAYLMAMAQDPEAKIADAITSVADVLKVERNRWIAGLVVCALLSLIAGWWTGHLEATPRTPYDAQQVADSMLATENKEHALKVHGPNAAVRP